MGESTSACRSCIAKRNRALRLVGIKVFGGRLQSCVVSEKSTCSNGSMNSSATRMVDPPPSSADPLLPSSLVHDKSLTIDRLMREFNDVGLPVQWGGEVNQGLEQAKWLAEPGDLILATGSLFTAVEVREQLKGIPPEEYPEFQDVRFSSKVR